MPSSAQLGALQAWDWGTFSQGCIVQAGPPARGWSQIRKWAVGRAPTSVPLPRWPENADFTPHGKTLAWAELPRAVGNVAPLTWGARGQTGVNCPAEVLCPLPCKINFQLSLHSVSLPPLKGLAVSCLSIHCIPAPLLPALLQLPSGAGEGGREPASRVQALIWSA